MSLLKKVVSATDVEEAEDRVGGGSNFAPIPSGIYKATIKAIYFDEAKSGALNATILADINVDGTNREYRETLYFTNKEQKPYYINKDTQKKNYLPGFNFLNAISLFTTKKELLDETQEVQQRVWSVYDYEQKKEVDVPKETLIEVMGKEIQLAILHKKTNKQAKNQDGVYEDTHEFKEFNEINSVFNMDGNTIAECKTKKSADDKVPAVHYEKWAEKWTGVVDDRYREVQGETSTKTTGTAPSGAKSKSLF